MIGDDLIAAARLAKAGIGATLGVFNIGHLFANYILLSFAVGAALTVSITAFVSLYGVLDFSITFLSDVFSSDWYSFISYTLNFDFLETIFSTYYISFILLISVYMGCVVFWLSVILVPHLLAVIRSTINWMTGDH